MMLLCTQAMKNNQLNSSNFDILIYEQYAFFKCTLKR